MSIPKPFMIPQAQENNFISDHDSIFLSARNGTGSSSSGFVLLISVVVIAAVTGFIAASLLFFSTSSEKQTRSIEASSKARGMADACAEIALDYIRQDEFYLGAENFGLVGGECSVMEITRGGEGEYFIKTFATVDSVTRKVSLIARRNTEGVIVTLDSWLEVADF